MAFSRNFHRLICIEFFGDQILHGRRDIFLEEECTERNTIIQCDKSLTDQWNDLQQYIVVDIESHLKEIGLETCGQILGRQEADMRRIEVIQFLEIDRGG